VQIVDDNHSSPDKQHEISSADATIVDSSARDLDRLLMEVKEQKRNARKRRRHQQQQHYDNQLSSSVVQHTSHNVIQHSAAEFLAGTKAVIDDNDGEGLFDNECV
jgi:hypothetical protein